MAPRDDAGISRVVIALAAVGVVVLSTGIGIGLVASGATVAFDAPVDGGDDAAATTQRDPEDVADGGVLSAIERQLAQRAIDRARSAATNLDEQDYERVRESLNNSQYEAVLDRYSEVAAETGNQNRSALLNSLSANQREYATAADAYWELHAVLEGSADLSDPENRSAAASLSFVNGTALNASIKQRQSTTEQNETITAAEVFDWDRGQRRQVVKRLEARWRRVNRTGATLLRNYRRLEATGSENYTDAIAAVRTDRATIRTTQETLRAQSLTTVEITASTLTSRGSFTDPIPVVGQLRTASGTALANEPIRLEIGGQQYRTRTSYFGHFIVMYRPATIPVNTSTVPVRFTPNAQSKFTSATTNVSVTVDQVRPDVSVRAHPPEVGFNETLTVSGRVGHDENGAGGVPYLVTLNDTFLTQGQTAPNGTFASTLSLPARVAAGNQQVRVSLLLQDQALAPTNATAPIRVRQTPTSLSIDVTRIEGQTVRVSGRLTAGKYGGLAGQNVRLMVNNASLGTVTTRSDGRFNTTVIVPQEIIGGGLVGGTSTLNFRAGYEAADTNFESAVARTRLSVRTTGSWPWIVGVAAAGLVLAGALFGYRRWRQTDDATAEDTTGFDDPVMGISGGGEADESLVGLARDQLSAGRPDVAIQLGYAAIRRQFEQQVGQHPSATHWEFYQACRGQIDDADATETLRRATELYERAVYASGSVSEETVASLFETLDETNRSNFQ